MKKRSLLFALALLLVLSLAFYGCAKDDVKPESQNGENIENTEDNKNNENAENSNTGKDELVLGFGYEPEAGWDPTSGSSHYGSPLFQSMLLKRDVNLNIVNDLAEGYTIGDDKLTYTVTVRDDAKWSDGEPVTAEDVAFTYELTKEKATAAVDLSNLESVNALDEFTVEFKLSEPDITFVDKMASLGIVPKHAYGPDYGMNPIGCGPFQIVEWIKGQQMIVEPNPYYFGAKPAFKKITYLFLNADQSIVVAQSGQVDIINIPINASSLEIEGYKLVSVPSIDNRGICFPFVPNEGKVTDANAPIGNDVTSDIAIRKALSAAVDRQKLIDDVLYGHARKASSVCDGMPWFNEETVITHDGDKALAESILEDAGWKLNADGVREKDGLLAEFDLYYAGSGADRADIAMFFAQAAGEIGIKVNPVSSSWDEIEVKMHSNPVVMGWGGYDPLELYNIYHSKMAGKEWYNCNFYSNPKVDEYFDKAIVADDIETAYDYFKKAQWDGETGLSTLGDSSWVWLVNIDHLYLVREGLEIGEQKIQPHGAGWPITDTIVNWTWQ